MTKKTKKPAANTNDTKPEKTKQAPKAKQLALAGTERPNRIKEIDEAAEEYRIARNERQAATKVESEKKTILKDVIKRFNLSASYFYEDEEGDTEEVEPIHEVVEDVKVNKVKQAKAKADE